MNNNRVLIIDDEPQIIRFLRIALQSEGYEVLSAENGSEGIRQAALGNPALIVLDLGLPDMDGTEVLKWLREWSQTPVLVLSVRSREDDKVQALDAGAHDYVTKPFGIQEFMARVRVLLRNRPQADAVQEVQQVAIGELLLDFVHRRITLAGEELHLSRKEYAMLTLLARHLDQVVTQQFLLEQLWGKVHRDDSHYLRILVGRLRQKLGDDPAQPRYIRTEQGVGYRLCSC
ncbi:transcriptional regulator [Pokkaliibacter plantistimulans]|uniref:Transcriptional regulator n=1 Tax=Pokkaliibacter plantistimulans TaxID=1635171 RepID=A0ABX5M059_9GAMM|nr:response regulator transcription factor [Pokkaliibacter plantistimulans]PXF30951.1 transcriptional regulator [Pokkaliibacter plantistimulans]